MSSPKEGNIIVDDSKGKRQARKYQRVTIDRDILTDEVKDSKQLQNVYKQYPIIPYAGTNENSGDGLLDFFYRLAKLSPTNGSCIREISKYVCGDAIEIIYIDDEYLDDEIKVTDQSIRTRFKEMMSKGTISEKSLLGLGKVYDFNYTVSGNGYLMLTLIETMGERTFKVECVDTRHIKPMIGSDKKENGYFVISKVWDEDYLNKYSPLVISEFPVYTETIKGVYQTIFHLQNGGNVHGRPESIMATEFAYSEHQNVHYRIKNTDNKWTGDLIIEAEAGDPNIAPMLTTEQYDKNFTNKSEDPLSVLYSERPYQTKQMFVYQVKPNSNENYYKVVGDFDKMMIIQAHGWSERLLGHNSTGGVNGNSWLFELYTKIPMIDQKRTTILYDINRLIIEIEKFIDPSLIGVGIRFYSKIVNMVSEMDFSMVANGNSNNNDNRE